MAQIKEKLIKGVIWSLIERFGYLSIQFLSNIVLARILFPNDYGLLGILLVFTSMSTVIADSGLAAALIQRKTISQIDKSTVFFSNIAISVIIYIIIFLLAPFCSQYFQNPKLGDCLRVIGIIIIIDSFSSIQYTLLNRNVNFKKIAAIKIVSALISVGITIFFAFRGLGIWALVIQYISFSVIRSILLWFTSNWKPSFVYSFDSFRYLFGYGFKLMLQTIISEAYISFQSILIGKMYNFSDLGYYTQAKQLQQIPVTAISTTINSVSFPVYAQLQDNKVELVDMFRKNLMMAAYINFPLMLLLSAIAPDLITFLYSNKWIDAVPYFQFLCLGFGLLLIVHSTNITLLKAIGESGIVLKLEILKKIIGVILILILAYLIGIWGVMIALAINSIIEFFLNGYFTGKFINYGPLKQFMDLLPILLLSILCAGIAWLITILKLQTFISLVISSIAFLSGYIILSKLFKFNQIQWVFNLIRKKAAL